MRKVFSFIATFSLLANSLFAPLSVLAQETPSPEPSATPIAEETITPSPEPSASPTNTPEEMPSPTVSPTPVSSMVSSPTPTPTDTPIATQSPKSNPTVQGPPTETPVPSVTPTNSPEAPSEDGKISAVILQNEKVNDSVLADFDLSYSEDGSATISTDKLDYSPTDTAVISGTGFVAEKTYTINITSSDDPVVDFSDNVTANDKGEILYSYTLDGNYRPDYQVKILDGERVVAETTFLDHYDFKVEINDGDTTTISRNVTLNLKWWAAILDPTQVRYANDTTENNGCDNLGSGEWSEWETITETGDNTATKSWKIASGLGTRKVCVETRHSLIFSHHTLRDSDKIERIAPPDTTPPTVVSVSSDGQVYNMYSQNSFDIKVTFSEDIVNTPEINISGFPYTENDCGDSDATTFCITYTLAPNMEYPLSTGILGATDAAGNVMIPDTSGHVFYVDNKSPTITLLGSSPIDVEAFSSYSDAGATASDTKDGDLTSSINTIISVNTSVPGTYTVTYDVSDSAGNNADQVTRTVNVIDTTPPSAPTGIVIYKGHVTDPASEIGAGGYTNTTQIRIAWNPNTEADVDYYWFGTKSNPHHKKVYNTFYDANMTPGNNPYYYTVSAVDKTGNEGLFTTSYQIILDMNAPSIPVLSWPTGGIYINDNTPLMQWQASIDDQSGVVGYNYQVYYNCSNLTDIPNSCTNHYLHPSLITKHQLQAGSTPDNTYYWQVRAKDNAGNIGEWSPLEKVIIDTVAPQIPTGLTRFTQDGLTEYVCSTTVQRQTLIPTWDAYTGIDFDHYEYTSFNPNGSIGLDEQSLTTNKFVHTWVPTSDGTYGYAVRTADKAGNKSDWALSGKSLAGSCQVTYDSTPPLAPVLIGNSIVYMKSGNVTRSWQASSSDDVVKYIYKSFTTEAYAQNPDSSPGWSPTPTISIPGQLTYSRTDPTGSNERTFWWRVAAVDTAGNKTWSNEIYKVVVDNTAPTGSWINPIDNETISGTVALNFIAQDNLSGVANKTYQYKADDEIDTFHNIVGDSWNTTVLPLGEYVVRAVVTDKAGNVAGDAGEFDITVGVAALVSNEQSTTPTQTSAIITWTTDRPTSSRVVYGTTPGVTLDPSLPNYGYAASTPTTDVSPHVLSHSVTINGLSDGTVYYFRTISEGSPTAIGGEHDFKTLTYAGGGSSGGDGGAAVLGATTELPISWPKLAYVETGEENTVLGAETDNVTVPSVLGATNEDQEKGGLGNWITTHKGLSLGIAFVVFGLSLLIIKKRKKD